MNSALLRNWTPLLKAVMLLISVLLLLSGHNEPGGGFVGGLVAATAFTVHALAYNVNAARRSARLSPRTLMGSGLLIALLSGLPGLLRGKPFLTGVWGIPNIPYLGEVTLGTPLVFDLGVYLVVAGVVMAMVFALMEDYDAT
jgi:multicomponent Na+:H+ antiporter subunit B